ncbi:MAG: hypothetical protein P4N41_07345 [Negativicutes bacterium]|nr:hypothetical protein [Negativicutes bacterium]
MFIIATFTHSVLLELAISGLEAGGIAKRKIFAAPLEAKEQQANILDTVGRADGISQLDGALLAGAFSSVVFTVFGSVLPGGPLPWGLFGLLAGGAAALALDALPAKKNRRKSAADAGEVVLIIQCEDCQAGFVEQVLTGHQVIGIARAK